MISKRPLVAPSLLAADFLNLKSEIQLVNASTADWLHLDVMDGSFVPNISFGMSIIEQVTSISTKLNDVHLMINRPEDYFRAFVDAGANLISFHLEATNHPHRAIQMLQQLGVRAGIAINPHTPISALDNLIDELDLVCVMSVNPGFGGQKFIPQTVNKIRKLKERIISSGAKCLIEVDGGVGLGNAAAIVEAGADVLVAGSAIFGAKDPMGTISTFKSIPARTISL